MVDSASESEVNVLFKNLVERFMIRSFLSGSFFVYKNSHFRANQFPKLLRYLAGINVMAGVGLLSTSYTVKQAGWASLLVLVQMQTPSCTM